MIDLKNVTIVSVACVRADRTLRAMNFSMREIKFGSAKILTSENIESNPEVEIIKIDHLDYVGYNKFVVYDLWKYIDTDYALLIQDDGFVANPSSWRDEFFKYDYIGAPWPLPKDNFSFRDPFGNIIRVGNGGFSFRSKKLLKTPTELNLEWKPYFGYYNEDGFLTCHNRHLIEEAGCVYAPIDVAKYFSHEAEIEETKGIEPFGFHSKWSKYNSLI